MFIVWLLILIIVIFIMIREADNITGERVSILGFSTKYFHMSNGESKKCMNKCVRMVYPTNHLKNLS